MTDQNITIITTIFTAFLTAIVGPIIVDRTRTYLESKRKKLHPDPLTESLKTNELVMDTLEKIKDQINCDRIWITQFHNGGHFYLTGKSIQKFSMFYELVSPGVQSTQQIYQNTPVSLFNYSINYLSENGYISIPDLQSKDKPTYGLEHIAEETGAKSSYLFSINTIEGKMLGIMGIEYIKNKKTLDKDKLTQILMDVYAIGGVLTNINK